MDGINPNDVRYQLYNSMCNVRDDNGDYLFDEEWIKEKILGKDIEEKENPDE
jgi:hypothetical protein